MRLTVLFVLAGCSSQLSEPPDVRWPSPQPAGPAAPFALTASDGSGLALTRVEGKAVVEGPLAFTELHLYFHNDEARVREGKFSITLPAHASISRFAMQIGDHLQEAEVVPKQLARRAYEDFLHRRQDPALLEKSAGNEFSARVFPISANEDKHLVISFSQELTGDYVLPLRGLPSIGRVDLAIDALLADGTHAASELHEQSWRPDRDFGVTAAGPTGLAANGLVALRFESQRIGGADEPTQLGVLIDTSASRALGFAGYIDSVGQLINSLRHDLPIRVIAYDQDTQEIYAGKAGGFGEAQRAALLSRGAAGASDLGQALAVIGGKRVVAITDGVLTAGAEQPALIGAVKAFDRFDVVLAGGLRDDHLATALARAGKRPGDVYDLDRGGATVAAGLSERVVADLPVTVAGASWVYPKQLPAVRRTGDPVTIYARLPSGAQVVDVAVGEDRRAIAIAQGSPALVNRAVAGAEIDELERRLAAAPDDKLRAEIATRSVAARVVSSETAMLVLETEADYARYNIDRSRLAEVLVIGPHGLDAPKRTVVASLEAAPVDDTALRLDEGAAGRREEGQYRIRNENTDPQLSRPQAIEAARSAGVLGSTRGGMASLTGTGDISSGFDSSNVYGGLGVGGGGRGGRTVGRATAAPAVVIAQPSVQGSLDRTSIRRYIRLQSAQITYCYERELLRRPRLAGSLTVQFSIDGKGRVTQAVASGFDVTVGTCVAEVIKKIGFPAIGSTIQVNYPFTFQIAGASSSSTPDPVQQALAERPDPGRTPPLTGKLADVMKAIEQGKPALALAIARQWNAEAPGDVLAWVALGEAYEASKWTAAAARAYGSIIDLFPARADLRRFAGERLERVGSRALVIDTYRRALADRQDHSSGHRLLAHALLRDGNYAEALSTMLGAVDTVQSWKDGEQRMFRDDVSIIAAAYLAHGGPKAKIEAELEKRDISLATTPSTRFILYWETDVNDVDFHIRDARGSEAYYGSRSLPSGGELFGDVTTGYGPECFAIEGKPSAGPYQLSLHYYSQGPMGYGMGLLQIERFDGKNVTLEDRPYVIMVDHAYVELGTTR